MVANRGTHLSGWLCHLGHKKNKEERDIKDLSVEVLRGRLRFRRGWGRMSRWDLGVGAGLCGPVQVKGFFLENCWGGQDRIM